MSIRTGSDYKFGGCGLTKAALVLLCAGLAACQTRTQATIVTVGAGSVGLVGGYVEQETRTDGPRYALFAGGAVAIISAVSMLFLDDKPWTLFETAPQVPGERLPAADGLSTAVVATREHAGRERAACVRLALASWHLYAHGHGSELLAAIHRTRCRGRCPAYTIAIYRDGLVEYRGAAEVQKLGAATAWLSADQLVALEKQLAQNIVTLHELYLETDCTDSPYAFIWYRAGGSTRAVAHNLGDRSAPAELFAVEAAIDAAVDIERWIGPSGGPVATDCR